MCGLTGHTCFRTHQRKACCRTLGLVSQQSQSCSRVRGARLAGSPRRMGGLYRRRHTQTQAYMRTHTHVCTENEQVVSTKPLIAMTGHDCAVCAVLCMRVCSPASCLCSHCRSSRHSDAAPFASLATSNSCVCACVIAQPVCNPVYMAGQLGLPRPRVRGTGGYCRYPVKLACLEPRLEELPVWQHLVVLFSCEVHLRGRRQQRDAPRLA